MKVMGALLLVGVLGGCTSVKLVQRDGCWVRQTKRLGSTREDIGPCARPTPKWSDDRLTRLVQECVAEEAHRWQTLALSSWSRNEPLPSRPTEETVVERCTNHATQSIVSENEALRQKLSEVSTDRDALRARSEKADQELLATRQQAADRLMSTKEDLMNRLMSAKEKAADRALSMQAALTDRLVSTSTKVADRMMSTNEKMSDRMMSSGDKMVDRFATAQGEMSKGLFSSQDKLAQALGEAASKPTPPAVATATATSEGTAKTDVASDTANETATTTPEAAPVSLVNAPTTTVPGQSIAAPACAAEQKVSGPTRRARTPGRGAKAAAKPACEPVAAAPPGGDLLPKKSDVTPAAAKQEVAAASAAKPPQAAPAPRADASR